MEMTIEKILVARKWRIDKLADKVGVHRATVYRWKADGPPKDGPARKLLDLEWKKICASPMCMNRLGVSIW
jgi:DNA-binding Xre family transcriptional regulator